MPDRNPDLFDASKPLLIASTLTIFKSDMLPGDPLTIVETEDEETKGAVTKELALRLWVTGMADYAEDARPTPVETAEQEADRAAAEMGRQAAFASAEALVGLDGANGAVAAPVTQDPPKRRGAAPVPDAT